MKMHLYQHCGMLLLLTALTSGAIEPPTADAIKKWPVENQKVLVYGTGFEDPKASNLRLLSGFRHAPGEGVNGNAAVRTDRVGDPARGTQWAIITLDAKDFTPGVQYTYSFKFRTRDLRCALPTPAAFVLAQVEFEMPKGKPGAPSRFQIIPPPHNEDFQPYSLNFTVPEGAQTVQLILQHRHYYTGTIWFDDVEVHSSGVASTVLLKQPRQSTFTTADGRFSVIFDGPSGQDGVFAAVELEQAGKTTAAQVVRLENGRLEGDFGSGLSAGPAQLNVWVADAKNQRLFTQHSFHVQVRAVGTTPANAVLTDEYGRLTVDGKPFMPIGIFLAPPTHEARCEAYRMMAKSGINTVMDYGCLFLRGADSSLPPGAKSINEGLDFIAGEGLRILFALQNICQNPQRVKNFEGESSPDAILKKLLPAISGHPAILGWYMNDEMEEFAVPRAVAFRELVNALDPWHPTLALTNLPGALPNYARTGDQIALDAYPLVKRADGDDISRISVCMAAGRRTGLTTWGVPQIFNWGLLRNDVDTPEKYAQYHSPDLLQIRAMNYLYAIGGARAFLLYNYPMPSLYAAKAAAVRDPDWGRRQLEQLPEIVAALKLAEPYIMGAAAAPEIKIENHGPATVEARAFRSDDGKLGVLIVGCGGKPGSNAADAVISIAGAPPLRSRFGRTTPLADGQYRFTAPGLDSDLLTE